VTAIAVRSNVPITDDDLRRLGEIARADREQMFSRSAHWAPYRDRLLAVALCQGAALHYLDGRNGVKDFDVWTFFAALPDRYRDRALYRRNKAGDYGRSKFGAHPDLPGYVGRKVDLLSDSIPVARVDTAPVDAIRRWLRTERRGNPRHLAQKAVVLIEPELGQRVWPES
jgi:hypothetical protein